ncbi:hypothetical protein MYA98_05520 [Salmonella sp. WGH-01]|nr:hypothetical protein MYA98_05520 [Salmonella sp. WGH-01]
MLHSLIDGQYRKVSCSRRASSIIERLHITQNGWWTIIVNHHPVNVILAG